MIRRSDRFRARAVALALCIAGATACSQPPAPSPQTFRAPDHDLVTAIRGAGASDDSVVEVAPLRDPAVQHRLDAAHAAERAGQYAQALADVDAALQLTPNAPDVLQYRAELEIRLKNYPGAEADARRSYELGPKVGGLCARNWQTVIEIERLRGNSAGVDAAHTLRGRCHVAGPIRM